ncbi:MAG: hypothetical protein C0518_08560 [Opitutus sp.]|nr:hypothetical protein [Opitutus sp.]
MRSTNRFLRAAALALLSITSAALAVAEAGRYLRAADFDVTTLIVPAPADDSLTTATDLEVVYQIQQRRTPEQVALAAYFVNDHVFQYDAAIGPWFTAENMPFTAEFFQQIHDDRYAISTQGKRAWKRPRPPLVDARIKAAVDLPKSGAYPSGHATQAFVWAVLLGEAFPEKRAALRARAETVAWSRVIGGVHYPSDIVAGRMLGEKLAQEFLKVPAVREALARVKAEAEIASKRPALED